MLSHMWLYLTFIASAPTFTFLHSLVPTAHLSHLIAWKLWEGHIFRLSQLFALQAKRVDPQMSSFSKS